MRISGFTLVRNGVKFDYPFLESLRSILPLVDELVINVGIGDDDTLQVLQKFAVSEGQGKVLLFESNWHLDDPERKRGGKILSEQTNLALDRCTGDWCVYLQADEVLHENDLPIIRKAMEAHQNQPWVEALLFHYVHFYGSFDIIRRGRGAYRREVRVIRRQSGLVSIGDAQSFRRKNGEKPNAVLIPASIYHYGWVRPPEVMKEKTFFMDQLYHGNKETNADGTPHTGDNYRYKRILGLHRFEGTHPKVMIDRVRTKNWNWDLANSPLEWAIQDVKKVVLDLAERLTGHRFFEYRSYRLKGRWEKP